MAEWSSMRRDAARNMFENSQMPSRMERMYGNRMKDPVKKSNEAARAVVRCNRRYLCG